MELDLDEYLRKQKEKLESDRLRLDIENHNSKQQSENRSDKNEFQLENNAITARESTNEFSAHQLTSEEYKSVENAAGRMDFSCPAVDLLKHRAEVISSSSSRPSSSDVDGERFGLPRCNRIKTKSSTGKGDAVAYVPHYSNLPSDSNLSKVEKECANARKSGSSPRSEKNAMEEWVSDTFYSYFPSFNVLDKKRENLAKDRKQDYQNYLKKISANESKPKRNPLKKEEIELPEKITKIDKSETEIIVNNPNPDSNTNKSIDDDDDPRPGSTKQKLLQDLKHTALSNIVNSNAVLDRNRIIVEKENKKKLEYQKQLMIQIEEKRNEAKALKEREKIEEELLTKKLEEQLKTMQLEDALEKERIKVEKARIANEQNQVMRMKLLAKLDNDKKLLRKRDVQSEDGKENINNKDNNVYKYFSNSARHNELNKYASQNFLDTYESDTVEPTLHNRPTTLPSENACSFCNAKLKTPKCLNCECKPAETDPQLHTLLCEICQAEFFICSSCDLKNTPCLFCHRRRNVCTDCIRNFCSHCGNVTRNPTPIVTSRSLPTDSGRRSKTSSIRSFKVLDISYEESDDDDSYQDGNYKTSSKSKKPYSMNIEKKSIFHPDNKIIEPKYEINIRNGEFSSHRAAGGQRADIFVVGPNTNERLSRYLKNYGDLSERACKSQSTQTGKDVERIETSPSIPLLRQTPKLKVTKISEEVINAKPESDKIKNLSQKWEIPVVQKNIISSSSPRILTQLGAIRKQLQIEQLELEPADKNV